MLDCCLPSGVKPDATEVVTSDVSVGRKPIDHIALNRVDIFFKVTYFVCKRKGFKLYLKCFEKSC